MLNPYLPQKAKIIEIAKQTADIKLFKLEIPEKISFQPGQIIFVSIPNFGEAPFAICSHPQNQNIEFCARKVGRLTTKIRSLKKGDYIYFRGPYGNFWPIGIGQNYLFVVGGLGLLPLRSLILAKNELLGANSKIQIFYGAKNSDEFLFKDEFDEWQKNGIDLNLTIDKFYPEHVEGICPPWGGCIGPVTILFDKICPIGNAQVFLCGPPIMYKFVIEKLKKCNFNDEDIYLSLERKMHCGIGVCQHCAIGPKYVCKDGPIFSWEEIKNLPDVF